MDKIVVFETFYNPIEANIVKARLMPFYAKKTHHCFDCEHEF
jgi:hypothetical protein